MSGPPAPPAPRRIRWRRAVPLLLALAGVGVWQGRVHLGARESLKEGRAALERGDPAAARAALDRCLDRWPRSAEAHLLAARAARKAGDLGAARTHLAAAGRFGHPADEVAVEEVLVRARSGELAAVAPELLRLVDDGNPQAADALELLVPAFLAEFRIVEAGALTAKWVELAPESVPAWTHRADVLERLRQKEGAVAALRRLVALAPESRPARLALARLLLETRQSPDEAAGLLEPLAAADPTDPTAVVQLAACREAQGRTGEAAALLDRVIAAGEDAKALAARGRLELNRGQPAAALPFLRRAAARDPSDVELLYAILLCVQRTGTPEEARAAEERWRRCDADLRRVAVLARAVSANPGDPDLRRELGELFLRNGREAEGVRWLESALRSDPNHAPTHGALAAYYERAGQPERAARHRAFAPGPPEKAP